MGKRAAQCAKEFLLQRLEQSHASLHEEPVEFIADLFAQTHQHIKQVCALVFEVWVMLVGCGSGVCDLVCVLWCLCFGVCDLVSGRALLRELWWCMCYGVCNLVCDLWCMQFGVCNVVYGLEFVVYVFWCMYFGV